MSEEAYDLKELECEPIAIEQLLSFDDVVVVVVDCVGVVEHSFVWAFELWCWIWRTRGEAFAANRDRSEHRLALVWHFQRHFSMRTSQIRPALFFFIYINI